MDRRRCRSALWPTDSFAAPLKTLFVTGEPIEIIHPPAAHTDGDLMVFFRKSDVIVAGDIFVDRSLSGDRRQAWRHAERRPRRR